MVQPVVGIEVVERPESTALGIRGAVHAAADARIHHEPGAHGAGFERHVHRATREAPPTEHASRIHHREELRVRGRVLVELAPVVGAGDDLAPVHHDGADGNLAQLRRHARLPQGLAHEALVVLDRSGAFERIVFGHLHGDPAPSTCQAGKPRARSVAFDAIITVRTERWQSG